MPKDPGGTLRRGGGGTFGRNPKNPLAPGGVYDPLSWLRGENTKNPGKKPPRLPGEKTTNPKPPAASGGGGYGGGGGGGGTADEGLSQYIQFYRLNYFPNGKPPAKLLKAAKDNNWSVEYFAQRVRMQDPRYLQSAEAKKLLPDFVKQMKMLFPGFADERKRAALMRSPFFKKTAVWYMRGGVGLTSGGGAEALYSHITNTKRWNQANPYWKAYATNRDINVQGESSPLVYKQLLSGLKQSFKDYGMELPEDYYKSFFKSRYASSEGIKGLATNLGQLATQSDAFQWFEGKGLSGAEQKSELFGSNKAASDLRTRMGQHFGIRQNFLGSQQTGAASTVNDRGKLIKPLL